MLLKHKKSWEMPQHMATDEALFLSRREWLKAAGMAGIGIAAGTAGLSAMMGAGLCCAYHRVSGHPQ